MKVKFTLLVLFLALVFPESIFAYYTYMPASSVLGQPDFTSSTQHSGGVSSSSYSNIGGLHSDGNKLCVGGSNRVLLFNSIPTSNNQAADVVIGQPDFVSTTANNGGRSAHSLSGHNSCWIDNNRLFVVDQSNNRVLIWNSFPTRNGQDADVVIGQPDFATGTTGLTASKMNSPFSVIVHNGKMIVSDLSAHRVLIWNSIPATNGVAADIVVGQTNFTTSTGGTTASKLSAPRGLGAYQNKLFIADQSNNRVLVFNSIPTTNGASADVVIGQPDFTSSTINNGGITCSSLNGPVGNIVVSPQGRMFVADRIRILIFNQIPTTNFQSADIVIGEPDCNTDTISFGGVTQNSLAGFTRLGGEINNRLIVGDDYHNRVLFYSNTLSGPQLSMNTPEAAVNSKLKVTGNVQLGERPRYSLQRMQANVNGQGFGNVTNLGGGTDDGTDKTRYDFYHEFEPWAGIYPRDQYDSSKGYTLQLKASSFNAEEDQIFYFTPFSTKSIVGSTINLNINKDHWDRIKSNLDSFEIQQKKGTVWTTLQEKIALNSESITTTKTLSGEIRVVAKDKWGHRQSVTNSLNVNGISSYNLNTQQVTAGFPLQINRISGFNTGIISTYQSISKTSFFGGTTRPIMSGIAYAGSTVTLLVTDPVIGRSQVFTTITKSNSSWQITPTLYNTSVIDVWVSDNAGRYTELPAFKLSVLQSQP